jgi:hypothetical protein
MVTEAAGRMAAGLPPFLLFPAEPAAAPGLCPGDVLPAVVAPSAGGAAGEQAARPSAAASPIVTLSPRSMWVNLS